MPSPYDFLIVCHQRSGSHLLASCLDTHLEICCLDENASHKHANNDCRSWTLRGRVYMYGAFLKLQERLLETPKFIHLTRDPDRQAFSCVRNSALREQYGFTYMAHLKSIDPLQQITQNFTGSQREVDRFKRQIESEAEQVRGLLALRAHMTVTYEEMTDNQSIEVLPEKLTRTILDFLRLPYRELSTELKKIAPDRIRVS